MKPGYILSALAFSFVLSSCQKSSEGSKRPAAPVVDNNSINIDKYLDKKEALIDENGLDTANLSKYQCAQSLCGSEYPFSHIYESNPQLIEESRKIILDKMSREIDLTMGQAIRSEIDLNKVVKNIESKPASVGDLTKEQIALLNVFRLLGSSIDYTPAPENTVNDKNEETLIFNREKLLKANPKLTPAELDALESAAPVYTNLISAELVDEMDASFYIDSFKTDYDSNGQPLEKKLTDEEALFRIYMFMGQEYERIKKRFLLPELIWNFNSALLSKAQKKEVLDKKERIEIVEMLRNITDFSMVISNPDLIEKFSKISYSKEEAIKDLMSNYNKNIGLVFNNKSTLKNLFAEAKDQCVTTLTKSLVDTPTEKENAIAFFYLEQIQLASNELIDQSMSQSVNAKLDIKFQLPMNQSEALNQWKKYFENSKYAMGGLRSKIDLIKSNEQIDGTTLVGLYFKYLNAPTFFEQVQYICQKSTPAFIDDAAMPEQNIFKASWVTVKHIQYGIGIMAHEVGHIISHHYPDLFKTQKSCLQDKNKTDLYVEEDFADLFSAKILMKMKSKGVLSETKNMSCGLGDFMRTKPENFSTTNIFEFDNHSSQLYRILSVASSLGQSTPQCQQYLDKYEPKAEIFKNYCSF